MRDTPMGVGHLYGLSLEMESQGNSFPSKYAATKVFLSSFEL